MSDRPEITPGEWITVGSTDCVVANVREHGHQFGDCEVVLNPLKPANCDAFWNGTEWSFVKTGDYGGYADRYQRLSQYVAILKRGRYA